MRPPEHPLDVCDASMVVSMATVRMGMRGIAAMPALVPMAMRMLGIAPRSMQVIHIVVVILMLAVQHHVEIATRDTRTGYMRDLDLVPLDRQAFQRRAHRLLVGLVAQIEQGPREHIARHAARALQVQNSSLAVPHAHVPLPAR